jgi:hypothetical protein
VPAGQRSHDRGFVDQHVLRIGARRELALLIGFGFLVMLS